jgi:hypothetical protein
MVDALGRRAEASDQTIDAVVAELLAEGLPTVLAEASAAGLKASLGRARPVEAQIVEHPLKVEKRSGLAPRALPGVKTRGQVTRGLPHAGPVKPVARKRCGAS